MAMQADHLCCPGCGCAEMGEGGTSASVAANASVVTDYRAILGINDRDNARWNMGSDLGTGAVVTYTFLEGTDLPDPGDLSRKPETTAAFSAAQRQAFRDAADLYAAASGLIFVEVDDPEDAMIDAHLTTGTDNSAGYASYPYVTEDGYTNTGGVLVLDYDASTSFAPGTSQFTTLMHELGHAVGLQHSHQGSVVLDPSIDDDNSTVMSYNSVTPYVRGLGPLDHDAVQYLYGSALTGVTAAVRADGRLGVTGTDGDDRVALTLMDAVFDGGGGSDYAKGLQGNDSLIGGGGKDTLLGSRGEDTLDGGGAKDRLDGGYDDDVLSGGAGGDRLNGGWGNDTLDGGKHKDRLSGDSGNDSIIGGGGDDRVSGGSGWDMIEGGRGDDRLSGDAGGDSIYGGRDDDRLMGGEGYDRLYGEKGHDLLLGEADSDTIDGGAGRDTLDGGAGNDYLLGGRGRDVFLFNGGADTVGDFGRDVIRIETDALASWSGTNGAALQSLLDGAIYYGNGTKVFLGGGDSLFVVGLIGREDAADAFDLI